MRITTRSVHFDADQKLLDYVEGKLGKIEKFFNGVIDVKVVMSLENSGQVRDKIVELNIKVPGRSILSKGSSKSFEQAFDNSLYNAKRQIRKYKERIQAKH